MLSLHCWHQQEYVHNSNQNDLISCICGNEIHWMVSTSILHCSFLVFLTWSLISVNMFLLVVKTPAPILLSLVIARLASSNVKSILVGPDHDRRRWFQPESNQLSLFAQDLSQLIQNCGVPVRKCEEVLVDQVPLIETIFRFPYRPNYC